MQIQRSVYSNYNLQLQEFGMKNVLFSIPLDGVREERSHQDLCLHPSSQVAKAPRRIFKSTVIHLC